MDKIDIQDIIRVRKIDTHRQLQLHLNQLGHCKYYWHYEQSEKQWLIDKGIMKYCELVIIDGVAMYYENEKIV